MDVVIRRGYRGSLKGVILDWAGTTVDYGSFAPTAVFIKLFASRGIPITAEHARASHGFDEKRSPASNSLPTGNLHKCGTPFIPRQAHIRRGYRRNLFAEFVPMQMECLNEYAQVIPGVQQAVDCISRVWG